MNGIRQARRRFNNVMIATLSKSFDSQVFRFFVRGFLSRTSLAGVRAFGLFDARVHRAVGFLKRKKNVEIEDFWKADQVAAATSQRAEFFELSPS